MNHKLEADPDLISVSCPQDALAITALCIFLLKHETELLGLKIVQQE